MEDFKPTYRATMQVIEAEIKQADAWLMDQVREAFMKEPNLTDEARAEFMANGIKFRHQAQRSGDYWNRSTNKADYFHLWRVNDGRNDWRDFRIVIRKNRTINLDKIVDAAISQVWRRLALKNEANVEAINQGEWDAIYNMSPSDYRTEHKIYIKLSKTKVGCLQVNLREHDWEFAATKTIRIQDLRAFKAWAEIVRGGMKKWAETAKEKS